MKTCSKCGIEKDEAEFEKERRQCRGCVRARKAAYAAANAEEVSAARKARRAANIEKIRERDRQRHLRDREKRVEAMRQYRIANHEAIRERERTYYRENKEARAAYKARNRARLNEQDRAKRAGRRKSDSLYAFTVLLRTHTYRALKGYGKNTKTERLLGLSFGDFFALWEARCEARGLSLDDAVVDHIVPLAAATNKTEAELLSHWSNLQPLTAEENLAKSDSMTPEIERRWNEIRGVAWLLDTLQGD